MSPAEPPDKGISRYRLTRQFSEGGLGRIWLARDGDLHREVVLKELQPCHTSSGDARRRFLREAQITGQLEHPNIVPVYDFGRLPGDRAWAVRDEVRGGIRGAKKLPGVLRCHARYPTPPPEAGSGPA